MNLNPWAGTGAVRYYSNDQRLIPNITPSAGSGGGEPCHTLAGPNDTRTDGYPVGTVYVRPTPKRRETWWDAFERTGDVSYFEDAAREARDHGLILIVRVCPLIVWNATGYPDGIKTWGRGTGNPGWLDTDHAPTMARFARWMRTVRDAVLAITPYVLFDCPMLGRVGEPRIDDVSVPQRDEYTGHQNQLTNLAAEVYGIERMVLFLWESSAEHPDGGNYGNDYLTHAFSIGKPAGSRQDSFPENRADYEVLSRFPLGALLLGDQYPTWFEQTGGDISAWYDGDKYPYTASKKPQKHLNRALGYKAASVAFMGRDVNQDPHAARNVRDVKRYWTDAQAFGREQITRTLSRIEGGGGDGGPPVPGSSTVTVEGNAWLVSAVQTPQNTRTYEGHTKTDTYPGAPWRVEVMVPGMNYTIEPATPDMDIQVFDAIEMLTFRTTEPTITVMAHGTEPPPDGDLEDRVEALEGTVARQQVQIEDLQRGMQELNRRTLAAGDHLKTAGAALAGGET